MKSLIHEHPDKEVRSAAIRLLDALTTWERNTGRHNIVIIKDSIGCEYRSMDGAPVPASVADGDALEVFDKLSMDQS